MEIIQKGRRAWKGFWKPNGPPATNGDSESESESTEQWVDAVVNFSSQYGTTAYCAQKVVGEPAVYPKYCDNVNALVVRHYGPWWLMCPSVSNAVFYFY